MLRCLTAYEAPRLHMEHSRCAAGTAASEQNVTGMLIRAGACEYVFFQGLGSGGM